ncbi:MAG: heme NO-binding domain-containing protein [Rhodobacter sp.]|nr:heme NO-binding domain-containing protein [Rhodobacter sp.]
MHGLINRSIQCFLRDTYGPEAWNAIMAAADLGFDSFEALLIYDIAQTEAVLLAACEHLGKPRDMLLEDLGTYLVSHPNVQAPRRLLRFGGETFVEFLHSLDELHDRARLAVADLELPLLDLHDHSPNAFTLRATHEYPGFGQVIVGVLRAMADDYGVLALLEFQGRRDGVETISIELLETCFAEGRDFALSAQTG